MPSLVWQYPCIVDNLWYQLWVKGTHPWIPIGYGWWPLKNSWVPIPMGIHPSCTLSLIHVGLEIAHFHFFVLLPLGSPTSLSSSGSPMRMSSSISATASCPCDQSMLVPFTLLLGFTFVHWPFKYLRGLVHHKCCIGIYNFIFRVVSITKVFTGNTLSTALIVFYQPPFRKGEAIITQAGNWPSCTPSTSNSCSRLAKACIWQMGQLTHVMFAGAGWWSAAEEVENREENSVGNEASFSLPEVYLYTLWSTCVHNPLRGD